MSRTHVDMIRRLIELEIPEVADQIVEVRSLAREPGFRSKIAVCSSNGGFDCVAACLGPGGSRVERIMNELGGENIDIVRWNDSLLVLIPDALKPANVEETLLFPMLGKAIVLVLEDQVSLANGEMGRNARLASKLVGWPIRVMTQAELDAQIEKSLEAYSQIPGVSDGLAEELVVQGFFTFSDLSRIEPLQLAKLGKLTPEQCESILTCVRSSDPSGDIH